MQITNYNEKSIERAVLGETYHVVPFFSNGHLVRVTTRDGVKLHGFWNEPEESTKKVFLYTHGGRSNFYEGNFVQHLESMAISLGYAFLTFNNRGHDHHGLFDLSRDFVHDFDIWLEFCQAKGYEEFILSGSSVTTHRILYYLEQKPNVVDQIILISPSNNTGLWQERVQERADYWLNLAKEMIDKGQGREMMPGDSYRRVMSAQTYYDRFGPDSIVDNFNFYDANYDFPRLKSLSIPTLIICGSADDHLKNAKDYLPKLEELNSNIQTRVIENGDHKFNGKEEELRLIIHRWLETL